jgi:DNA-binding helix-hairpin-helix protein with protein kinase domain
MGSRDFFDHLGRKISLGTKLGAGAEGSVFEITGNQDFVAKVYHENKPLPTGAELKLPEMVARANDELCRVAAWPIATLHERAGGRLIGFAMRRLKNHKEAHALYGPDHRKASFPEADWRFLIHTAANCAAAFDALHRAGAVMGDVNERNVMVSPQGMIVLIDCDSFQIQANNHILTCGVGVPEFTPPELQGKTFRSITRTQNHDRFGLAVLIFRLLFMGKHPFAGRYLATGDMPIEKAIKEFRFPYGKSARQSNMQPPLHALPDSAVSPDLGELFQRAFGVSGVQSNSRPSPSDWFGALKTFLGTLRSCAHDPGHVSPTHIARCIWCELVNQGAPNFFISVSYFRAKGHAVQFVLATVWAKIDRVARPHPTYTRPPVPVGYAPMPWPRNLSSQLPPEISRPTILTSPPSPPAPKLPPQKHRKTVVSPTSHQHALGFVSVLLASAIIPVVVLGAILGQAIGGRPGPVGWAAGGLFLLTAIPFAISWGLLEMKRREEEARLNKEYQMELLQRQALAAKQLNDWKHELEAQQAVASCNYETRVRDRAQVVQAMKAEGARRQDRVQAIWLGIEQRERAWCASASDFLASFDRKKGELMAFRDHHNELAARHASDRQQLHARARESQKEDFLQRHFISDEKISDIGGTRQATLASYGIETAFDISEARIDQVPGFGPKLTRRLLSWRLEIEGRFVFQPSVGVPADQQQALEQRYFQAQRQVEIKLLSGEKELTEIVQRVNTEFGVFREQVSSQLASVAQANADLTVVPRGCV